LKWIIKKTSLFGINSLFKAFLHQFAQKPSENCNRYAIKLFNETQVRVHWDDEQEKWYSKEWVNQRLKSIEVCKELTDKKK
jgi:hypothetical protein